MNSKQPTPSATDPSIENWQSTIGNLPFPLSLSSRTGKIARLPCAVRDQLNQRLKNGHKANSILAWLNSLPDVRSILDTDFHGQPVSPANLTNWKQGGYRDWLIAQNTLSLRPLSKDGKPIDPSASPSELPLKLAQFASLYYPSLVANTLFDSNDDPKSWNHFHRLCEDICRLLRADRQCHS